MAPSNPMEGREMNHQVVLSCRENQARGLGRYALDFIHDGFPDPDSTVFARVEQFHLDAVACGISALARGTRAPTLLRDEALNYVCQSSSDGVNCFGSDRYVWPEKAVVANCSAVREWDANGTNFGYNPRTGNTRGEFGHNDFYSVAAASAQLAKLDGRKTLKAMICLDEIRGRLAEVFALRDHRIDHVVHGAIASAAVFGAALCASDRQIESAIGLVVAHYIPFRAIRSGQQLSDSKGASAALIAELAVLSVRRAMRGLVGPADIFRNEQALFCLFEPTGRPDSSPFDLILGASGSDFAVMDMHFKLGLYEHQSAGAIQALIDVLSANPHLVDDVNGIKALRVRVYEPAFSIICDPAKRDPRTRQSADHSLVYIIASLLRKAMDSRKTNWQSLMLMPQDYQEENLMHPMTRMLMQRIQVLHGGPEYDSRYPDGIPTSVEIDHVSSGVFDSGLVMYPIGHARNTSRDLSGLLEQKIRCLAADGVEDVDAFTARMSGLAHKSVKQIRELYQFELRCSP